MKVLVTGAQGQLGRELVEKLNMDPTIEVLGYDVNELDITNHEAVMTRISAENPEIIINTAAYTNVDGCESDYKGAYAVNVKGPRNLAIAARNVGAKLLHISTDFVFDGKKTTPYFEYDAANPLSVYGKTKLAGEHAIIQQTTDFFIIRSSWLYGKYGNNFVKTMIKMGKTNDSISVVADQVGCPTSASSLVSTIEQVIRREEYGIYHFSNSGSCSWNGFAKEIFRLMSQSIKVEVTNSSQLARPAARPSYSAMDTSLISNAFDIVATPWEEALHVFIMKNSKTLKEL